MLARHPLLAAVLTLALPAQQPGALFDEVVDVLAARFHDRTFATDTLPGLAAAFRPEALGSPTPAQERAVVHGLLAQIPASHLALYTETTYHNLIDHLAGRAHPTVGCSLVQEGGRFWITSIHEAGPAARAGLLRGDRVVAVDGRVPGASPRLDGRSDDAFLPDRPRHGILVADGDTVLFDIERRPGERLRIRVIAEERSGVDSEEASRRQLLLAGQRVGYLHLHFVHLGASRLLADTLADMDPLDGFVLDLRGRGGSVGEVLGILSVLGKWCRDGDPVLVALIDRDTRSAKEVIAWQIRERQLGTLLGERTAGAVIPASFARVGQGAVLMFPEHRLGRASDALELVGVAPDRTVADPLPFAAGEDPILAAGLREAARLSRAGGRRPRRAAGR